MYSVFTSWDAMVVTFEDAEGKDTEEYIDQFYLKNLKSGDGIVCAIDFDNRQIYFYTSRAAVDCYNDMYVESILANAFDYVTVECYAEMFESMLHDAARYYAATYTAPVTLEFEVVPETEGLTE